MNKNILVLGCTLILTSCASMHQPPVTATPSEPGLNVNIQDGQIAFGNNSLQPYTPINFQIGNGECKRVTVIAANSATTTTSLKSCFSKGILFIDQGRFNFDRKSLLIHSMPLWAQGFTYQNISSNGPAHLTNVTVTVKSN